MLNALHATILLAPEYQSGDHLDLNAANVVLHHCGFSL